MTTTSYSSSSTTSNQLLYKLRDGRILSYEVYGDIENGIPVLFSHGLSDSRLLRHYDDELTKSLGVKIIAVDQPGVGKSTNVNYMRSERTLLNYAKDIEELVDRLGIPKFAVAGHSGGGPHALAIAYYMRERVTNGVLAAPAPPLDEDMIPGIIEAFNFPYAKLIIKFCQLFPLLIHLLCYPIAWWANYDLNGYIKSVAENDRTNGNPETFYDNPKQTQVFVDSFTEGFAQGPAGIRGMFQVAILNSNGWGFDLRKDINHHSISS